MTTYADTDTPFPLAALVAPEAEPEQTLAEQFASFHEANPWVADALEQLLGAWFAAGHQRGGVKQMWEVVRYRYGTTTGRPFKCNNNLTSHYARLLIERHPEWSDGIETRRLRAA